MNTTTKNTLTVDGREVPFEDERNLLEVIRKAGVDLPTFCYHSDLSVYGACRLCLVEETARGVVAACSTPPEPGMVIRTGTRQLREMRKIAVELLLANHDQSCPTCLKSRDCQLQSLARRLGVTKVRFKPVQRRVPLDESSPAVLRDPNKCVLCGDCVRMCSEIQGVGAIGFAFRGHKTAVLPAFGKHLGDVECVGCGQCASVCPTGALTPRPQIDQVLEALDDQTKTVVVQVAPAVRVGLGESFGLEPGSLTMGRMVAALKLLGFDQVYDTTFSADLTVIEESEELLRRKTTGGKLPQFTSCCPAWVRFAEQYYPELLPNLSTCRSPQQMFGSLVKKLLPEKLGVARENLVVVSIMPCTAKKMEAKRPEFAVDGRPDVDFVLTTQELALLIESAGLDFLNLEPESLDMPFGFSTGAGVIFGNSGGVTEAVLRYVVEKIEGKPLKSLDFKEVRGESGLREASLEAGGQTLRLAVVYGLANARAVAERVKAGEADYDVIEVMACPGGCIGGAGQPVSRNPQARHLRTQGLYKADKIKQLHKSQDNVVINQIYEHSLGEPGGEAAHHLLHTHYQSRRRIADEYLSLLGGQGDQSGKVRVEVCLGSHCYAKGSQTLLSGLLRHIGENGLENMVDVRASFCTEHCESGPVVKIGEDALYGCSLDELKDALYRQLRKKPAQSEA